MKEKKAGYANVLIMLVLIIFVFLFGSLQGNKSVTITSVKGEDAFMIEGPESFSYRLDISSISEVYLKDQFEKGNALEGRELNSCQIGTWENEEFGMYIAAVNEKITKYVVVYTAADQVLVVNFESEDATEGLYRGLLTVVGQE